MKKNLQTSLCGFNLKKLQTYVKTIFVLLNKPNYERNFKYFYLII